MSSLNWINKKSFGNFHVLQLESNEDIFLMRLDDDQNKFNDTSIKYFNQTLDYIESCENASCLITIGESPKFFSSGLDLDWAMPLGKAKFIEFVKTFHALLARLLVFPIPTIACINGHAFAGGAMYAIAHDFRVMRDDKGFFCLPEVDIHIPLTPGMNSILQSKITNSNTFRDTVLLGKRFGGKEAKKLEIVDVACKDILEQSVQIAEKIHSKGKDRYTFGSLKKEMYRDAYKYLIESSLGETSKLAIFDSKL
ncbi:hypothetical protein CYY_004221 [Polysphondylium violaceum]|uniref:Enoyl-CoA hydratase/isomerase family protein n=1 Tax=Polysphondylium violaceum TaxID=133409 RepID=A0A8J4UT60_9MYCE|nr:hypothetical protein CYY_004221 [Polysphondylium violaceum]